MTSRPSVEVVWQIMNTSSGREGKTYHADAVEDRTSLHRRSQRRTTWLTSGEWRREQLTAVPRSVDLLAALRGCCGGALRINYFVDFGVSSVRRDATEVMPFYVDCEEFFLSLYFRRCLEFAHHRLEYVRGRFDTILSITECIHESRC